MSKRVNAFLLVIAMLITNICCISSMVFAANESENLVVNGNFEDATTEPWVNHWATGISLSTEEKASDTASLYVDRSSTNKWSGIKQFMPSRFKPGETYLFQAKVMFDEEPIFSVDMDKVIFQFNFGIDAEYQEGKYFSKEVGVVQGEWTLILMTYTIPNDIDDNPCLLINSPNWTIAENGGPSFYLDDVSVTRTLNMVENGDFEESDISMWSANYNSWIIHEALERTSVKYSSSTHSLYVKNRWNNESGPKLPLVGKLEQGKTYVFQAKVMYNEGNAEQLDFQLMFGKDDDGNKYFRFNAPVKKGEWTTISNTCTIPSDIDVNPSIMIQTVTGNGVLWDDQKVGFYIDDVSIVQAKDIVANGNFESGTTEPWYKNWWLSALAIVSDPEDAANNCLEISGRLNQMSSVSQDIQQLTPGGIYKVSAKIRRVTVKENNLNYRLIIQYGLTEEVLLSRELAPNEWEILESEYIVPLDVDLSKITIFFQGGETWGDGEEDFYIDDVSIVKVKDLVANGEFASSKTQPWYNGGWEAALTVVPDNNNEGNNCLKISTRVNAYSGVSQDITGRLTAGAVYKVSAKIKHTYNASSTYKLLIDYGDGDSKITKTLLSKVVNANTWEMLEGEYIVPSDADLSKAIIYFQSDNGVSFDVGVEDFYIDDVSIMPLREISTIYSKSSGKLNISVFLTNKSDTLQKAVAVVALYDVTGNKLLKSEILPKDIESDEEKSFFFNVNTSQFDENYKTKIFVWDGLEKMNPLTNSTIISE